MDGDALCASGKRGQDPVPQLDFIRVKDPEHIAELAIFAEGIFREYFSTLHEPEKVDRLVEHLLSIETLTAAIADEGYEYYFVDDGTTGEHIGFIGIRPDDGFLYLSKLYLVKDARGKGLGRAEFEFVKQRAQDLGLARVRLTCARDNVASLDRYDRMGFKRIACVNNDVGGGFEMNDYLMEYTLEDVS